MKLCLNCSSPILAFKDYRQKYCNHSCAATHLNGIRSTRRDKFCVGCAIKLRPNQERNNYCSILCKNFYLITDWKKGQNFPLKNGNVPSIIRKFLIEESDNRCSKCGWKEVNPITGKVPVQINHIDGNSSNNRRTNLEVLCPNCHSLTTSYGALNKGKGRKDRYK